MRQFNRSQSNESGYVSASELATMAVCEQQVVFDARHGKQLPPAREAAAAAGEREHAAFDRAIRRYHRSAAPLPGERRCYIATCVYGPEAWQTEALRAYRDRVLLVHGWGRWTVALYYAVAPSIVRVLGKSSVFRWLVRRLLDSWLDNIVTVDTDRA